MDKTRKRQIRKYRKLTRKYRKLTRKINRKRYKMSKRLSKGRRYSYTRLPRRVRDKRR